jgi:hypothetical protein
MANLKFANFAISTIADVGGISAVATMVNVQAGDGNSLFPALGANEYFYCTLVDTSANREIVKVTARSSDAFTIVRGQQGTSGRIFAQNDKIELRPTAGDMEDLQTQIWDADTDTGIQCEESADEDIIRLEAGGTEQIRIKSTRIEINLGGGFYAEAPQNGVAANAVLMTGNSDTIAWYYVNTAPPGWKVLATGADSVLGIAGGAGAFDVNGGSPDSNATWVLAGLTVDEHFHDIPIGHTGAYLVKTGAPSGGSKTVTLRNGNPDAAISSSANMYRSYAATANGVTSDGSDRPKASVGRLFQLNTA